MLAALVAAFARTALVARVGILERALAVAAGGTFFAWLTCASVDWMHLLPN